MSSTSSGSSTGSPTVKVVDGRGSSRACASRHAVCPHGVLAFWRPRLGAPKSGPVTPTTDLSVAFLVRGGGPWRVGQPGGDGAQGRRHAVVRRDGCSPRGRRAEPFATFARHLHDPALVEKRLDHPDPVDSGSTSPSRRGSGPRSFGPVSSEMAPRDDGPQCGFTARCRAGSWPPSESWPPSRCGPTASPPGDRPRHPFPERVKVATGSGRPPRRVVAGRRVEVVDVTLLRCRERHAPRGPPKPPVFPEAHRHF